MILHLANIYKHRRSDAYNIAVSVIDYCFTDEWIFLCTARRIPHFKTFPGSFRSLFSQLDFAVRTCAIPLRITFPKKHFSSVTGHDNHLSSKMFFSFERWQNHLTTHKSVSFFSFFLYFLFPGHTFLFDMLHDCIMNRDPESVHSTMTSVPAPIRIQPIRDFTVNSSCRKIKASINVMTTLSLSTGTTLDASPICKAL